MGDRLSKFNGNHENPSKYSALATIVIIARIVLTVGTVIVLTLVIIVVIVVMALRCFAESRALGDYSYRSFFKEPSKWALKPAVFRHAPPIC